jgi:hypothetical protein
MDDAQVHDAIRAALVVAGDWFQVADALRVGDGGDPLVLHRAAFSYMLVERDQEDLRGRYGPLAPMIETADGVYPAPLDLLPPEAAGIWTRALEVLDAPLLQSRYGDLLWCIRHGPSPHRHARAALAAYEVLSTGDDELLTATHSTQRALEIALELNDRDSADRIAASAVGRADRLLADGPERPGVVLRLLGAAAALPPPRRPTGLTAAALHAERVYEGDPRLGDAVADLLAALAPDETRRREIRLRQVGRWQEAIDRAASFERQVDIQHGLELATLHGLPELATALRRQLQASLLDPIDLQEVGGEVELPRADIERAITSIVGDDSAPDALRRLAGQCPTGDPASHLLLAEEMRTQHPIQFLVTRVVISEENIPLRIIRSPEEHLLAQIRRQEVMAVRFFAAMILLPTLDALVERYGVPATEEVATMLEGGAIDHGTAGILAEQIVLVLRGEADDPAAHSLVPRIERVIRELARRAGVLIIREPSGDKPGGVRSLGAILADLDAVLPETWRRYFICLLTDDLGINLRNRVAHGLVEQVERQDAALLAHAALSLSGFTLGEVADEANLR